MARETLIQKRQNTEVPQITARHRQANLDETLLWSGFGSGSGFTVARQASSSQPAPANQSQLSSRSSSPSRPVIQPISHSQLASQPAPASPGQPALASLRHAASQPAARRNTEKSLGILRNPKISYEIHEIVIETRSERPPPTLVAKNPQKSKETKRNP